jgi:hypothetical protein
VRLGYDELVTILTVSHLWLRLGMVISYMPKMEDGYHLLVMAREYLSGSAEARPLKQGISGMVADFFYEKVNC